MVVRGRDVNSDSMMTIKVSAADLEPLFQQLVQEMETELKLFFTQQPPDVVTHAIEQGIYMTGGGSLLRGMTQLLSDHLQTDVIHSSHATTDVINSFKKIK
jgi:rod shape-determining protein MreB and related proteins